MFGRKTETDFLLQEFLRKANTLLDRVGVMSPAAGSGSGNVVLEAIAKIFSGMQNNRVAETRHPAPNANGREAIAAGTSDDRR